MSGIKLVSIDCENNVFAPQRRYNTAVITFHHPRSDRREGQQQRRNRFPDSNKHNYRKGAEVADNTLQLNTMIRTVL